MQSCKYQFNKFFAFASYFFSSEFSYFFIATLSDCYKWDTFFSDLISYCVLLQKKILKVPFSPRHVVATPPVSGSAYIMLSFALSSISQGNVTNCSTLCFPRSMPSPRLKHIYESLDLWPGSLLQSLSWRFL